MVSRVSVRVSALLAVAMAIGMAPGSAVRAQRAAPPGDVVLPPMSWTCPMHPDVVESKAGNCPICKMNLVAVRLDSIWTCPVHSVIVEKKPGTCPIDKRELVRMTVALSWTCPDRPEINEISPGTCPDGGAPMEAKYTPRPHGNHNPQHGGQFFMAPDNWHHLEGVYPRAGVAQIYLYDDYTQPLPLDQAQLVKGRIVTKENFDAATRTTKELAAFPLVLARDGRSLTAAVDSKAAPAQMSAKVRFKQDGPEYRFDFTFPGFSKDPKPAASTPRTTDTSMPAAPAQASPVAGAPAPQLSPAALAPVADQSQIAVPIPETVEEMVAQLKIHTAQIGELIDSGAFLEVWVPAFRAKDLALALEAHSGQMPAGTRQKAAPAIKRLVQTAWLLDGFGDLGNREQISDAYARFTSAVAEVQALFPNVR